MSNPFEFDKNPPSPNYSEQLIAQANERDGNDGAYVTAGCLVVSVVFLLCVIGGGGYIYYQWDATEKEKKATEAKEKARQDANTRARLADLEDKLRTTKKKEQEQVAQDEQRRQQWIVEDRSRQERIDENTDRELKKIEADERQRRLGSLSASEYRDALRCLELVKKFGIDRYGPDTVRKAAMIDPVLIADMQRKLGEKRTKKN